MMGSSKQKFSSVKSVKSGNLICKSCVIAQSYFSRLRGLIGKKSFDEGEGMLITRCNSIHMWFMSVGIDVVFLKQETQIEGQILAIVSSVRSGLKAWRILPVSDSQASDALELPLGTIQRCQIEPGDQICIG